jgi:hypothetical protein
MSYTDPYPRGRPSSWFAVAVITAGFVVGGLGLILGPTWWLFWAGVVIAGIGGILALALDIFSDVEVDHAHGPEHLSRRQRARAAADKDKDPQVDRRADDPYAQEEAPDSVARGDTAADR